MHRVRSAVLATLASACVATASAQIHYTSDTHVWNLRAGEMSYSFGVNERGELQAIHWGGLLSDNTQLPAVHSRPEAASFDLSTTTTPQEYPGWGAGLYTEPALKATFADGNREVVLHYVDQHTDGDQLDITLKDIEQPLFVHLHYRVYPQSGILERSSTIENRTKQALTLEDAASAAWTLPLGDGYGWHWLTGRWGAEYQLHSAPIQTGAQVLESRRGSTSHQANPWFAIDRPGETTEMNGPVWFGELGWSGSWRFTVEQTSLRQVRLTGGYNPFDFGYLLAPGESLQTPPFYAGYTAGGLGEASRILHRFQRTEILPQRPHPRPRPVLYNSWEATGFDVDEAGQIALADKAAKIGIERFVIDDGWFGQRKDDHAGLGDWYVNQQKFPHGLKPVIDHVHSLGMDFGIWVEPEMVNPDSDLYRKHPDWAMHFNGRPRTEGRNQLVLNLAREDVKEYTFHWLDRLVTDNDIAFLKWDYNRNWSDPGWPEVPLDQQKQIWVKYVNNLYDILDRLRAKHPKLEIESCSGGGGRVDLGILKRTDEVWTSDNTDALDRLTIQDGFTHAYTPEVMMAWVTDVPNFMNGRTVPLRFRFLVAMTGSLGIGSNLNKFSPEEMEEAAAYIRDYKTIRSTIQAGERYRLAAPEDSNHAAVQYIAQDGKQAVVFAFLHSQQFGDRYPTLRLRGLQPDATYSLKPLEPENAAGRPGLDPHAARLPETATGSYLMHVGVQLPLRGDYDSAAVVLQRTP